MVQGNAIAVGGDSTVTAPWAAPDGARTSPDLVSGGIADGQAADGQAADGQPAAGDATADARKGAAGPGSLTGSSTPARSALPALTLLGAVAGGATTQASALASTGGHPAPLLLLAGLCLALGIGLLRGRRVVRLRQ